MKKLLIKNIAEFEAVKAYIKHNKELRNRIIVNAFDRYFESLSEEGRSIYFILKEAYDQKYRILWSFDFEGRDPLQFKDFVEFFDQIPKKVFTFHDLEIGDVFVWPEYRKEIKRIKVSDDGFWIIDHNEEIVKGNPYFKGIKKDTEMQVELIKAFKD